MGSCCSHSHTYFLDKCWKQKLGLANGGVLGVIVGAEVVDI